MARIFGFDIGTTSIGFAVIDHDPARSSGSILRLGVRIFPEARDTDGTPFNQVRRQKRMARRQFRRRKIRRRLLNELLHSAGLLPPFGSKAWVEVMSGDPYELRKRGLSEVLGAHELGRALYHLAHRRHFKTRDLEDTTGTAVEDAAEKEALSNRESTLQELKKSGTTLGAWLAERNPGERRRGIHATRAVVEVEFARLWDAQAQHHPSLGMDGIRAQIEGAVFAQRPVFWRKNTLGVCRFIPGEPLCPRGSWLSQQRRMLEKLNNLEVASGNNRPLDVEERAAILGKLERQESMSWSGVRAALKPLYKKRGDPGAEKALRFNLEIGGEPKLPGNLVEAKLAGIFGDAWADHPYKQGIRDAIQDGLWKADYGEIGTQRVVILREDERKKRRAAAAQSFVTDFNITSDQASVMSELALPAGWEPFSIKALNAFLPKLEEGIRFGALVASPEYEAWRSHTFPDREAPTGEVHDSLPSPARKEERDRIAKLRNPTVVRTQNELRKVVNNLIGLFGKPDLIRIELAREVGKSKREREEMKLAIRKNERRRNDGIADLKSKGITDPSRDDVEKWMLWKESLERCPYTGDQIGFDALFRNGEYDVEHIWPRSRSFDNSFRNKTLCRKQINIEKGNRTPFEYLGHDPDRWTAIVNRLQGITASRGGTGMSPGKVKRFLASAMLEDFTARQLVDTSYAARLATAQLKKLWPDIGPTAPVTVQPVTGRVTAQLRKLWGLNNILSDDGEKTRADHRHHAIDALAVACTHPGITNVLSRYWQERDVPGGARPQIPPPWPTIRTDADAAIKRIVVSHRVRRKVSGQLHKETVHGDKGRDVATKSGTYRQFVTRKPLTSVTKSEIAAEPNNSGEGIADAKVRAIIRQWVADHGGDPKKAFPPFPKMGPNGPEIRKVRLLKKQQLTLMAPVSTGYADLGGNHHIAIYRGPDGRIETDVVSLFQAARRLAKREPIVNRSQEGGRKFLMSLSPGDAIRIPDDKNNDDREVWTVTGIWASGQIVIEKASDAAHGSTTRPMAASIVSKGAQKISIDPIGRVRRAGD